MPADTVKAPSRLRRFLDSDIGWSFCHTPVAWLSALVLALLVLTALFAPLIAPQNPYDLAQVFIDKAEIPPIWQSGGEWPFLLGTDPQGRDVLSAILYGSRISLIIGFSAVVVSMLIGVSIGLCAGFYGGRVDNLLMRLGDTVLSIPTLLMAILVSAIFREMLPPALREPFSAVVLVLSIALTSWVQYARTVRALTMVERRKEYVLAARIIKVPATRIMGRHILPNTMTPVLVSATLSLGLAILSEATLSFLGVGLPVTEPSLGMLIANGFQYMLSGRYWISIYPGIALIVLIVAINLVGDRIRDQVNPRLKR